MYIPEWIVAELGLEKAEEVLEKYPVKFPEDDVITPQDKKLFFDTIEVLEKIDELKARIIKRNDDHLKKLEQLDKIATILLGTAVSAELTGVACLVLRGRSDGTVNPSESQK
jgi:hypothetical protein